MKALAVLASLISIVLLALRLDMARVPGLGDAQALYLAYALHPQPTYLDHPGLIGMVARWIGPAVAPSKLHAGIAVTCAALPWAGVLAARACGAAWGAALRSYFPIALIPELSIGSAAFEPNLLLAFAWLLTLGCAGVVVRYPSERFGALLAGIGAAFGAAACVLSKHSGWPLVFGLGCVCLSRVRSQRFRSLAPWAALVLFGIVTAPLVQYWLQYGWGPRLEPPPNWQHVAATLLSPVLFVTPPFLYAGVLVGRGLWRRRGEPVSRLFCLLAFVPLVPQVLLGILSPGARGWLLPTCLTLAVYTGLHPPLRSWVNRSCVGLGLVVAALGWAWIRTDLPVGVGEALGGYDPRRDPSNDLYAWGPGRELLEQAVASARQRTGQTPLVVGPHWAVCAQAEIALAGRARVECDSARLDDYDRWSAPNAASTPTTILFVTDSRFDVVPPEQYRGLARAALHQTEVRRFGRVVRHISASEFDLEATAQRRTSADAAPLPASRAKVSTSSSGSMGFARCTW